MVEIHAGTSADLPGIRALWNWMIAETTFTFTTCPKEREDLEGWLAANTVLVAARGEDFLGFASTAPFRAGPGYRHVAELTIYVTEGAKGTGVADDLLEALELQSVAGGLSILVAGTSADNARAYRFFERHGYIETARMPGLGRKFDQTLDLVLQQKTLTNTPINQL